MSVKTKEPQQLQHLFECLTPKPTLTGIDPDIHATEGPLTLEGLRATPCFPASVPTEDITIPSRSGVLLNARVYVPCEGVSSSSPPSLLPIFIFIHGGGWVRGTLDSYNPICSKISKLGVLVVSLEYRLSPESKFPTPVEDVVDCTRWILKNRKTIRKGSSDQTGKDVVFIGGDSAGGHLTIAALVSIIQEEGSLPPEIVGEVLVYPATDPYLTSESWKAYGNSFILTRRLTELMWGWFLRSEEDKNHPLACLKSFSPTILAKLPPTLIFTAEFDPLRDEGEVFGESLNEAGVEVQTKRILSVIHGFFSQSADTGLPVFEPYSILVMKVLGSWIAHILNND